MLPMGSIPNGCVDKAGIHHFTVGQIGCRLQMGVSSKAMLQRFTAPREVNRRENAIFGMTDGQRREVADNVGIHPSVLVEQQNTVVAMV